jgi:hypothetical protein
MCAFCYRYCSQEAAGLPGILHNFALVDNMVMNYYIIIFYKTHLRHSPSSKIHDRLENMKSKMLFLTAALATILIDDKKLIL